MWADFQQKSAHIHYNIYIPHIHYIIYSTENVIKFKEAINCLRS